MSENVVAQMADLRKDVMESQKKPKGFVWMKMGAQDMVPVLRK